VVNDSGGLTGYTALPLKAGADFQPLPWKRSADNILAVWLSALSPRSGVYLGGLQNVIVYADVTVQIWSALRECSLRKLRKLSLLAITTYPLSHPVVWCARINSLWGRHRAFSQSLGNQKD